MKTFTILFITLVLFGCNSNNSFDKQVSWMYDVSEIDELLTIKKIDFFDNGEWGKIVKFSLSERQMNNLFEKYLFDTLNFKNNVNPLVMMNSIEKDWYDNDQNVRRKGNFLLYRDCKEANQWFMLIHQESKTLWFEIHFPDFGGDYTPCQKDSSGKVISQFI
jgi:hypothetical protein